MVGVEVPSQQFGGHRAILPTARGQRIEQEFLHQVARLADEPAVYDDQSDRTEKPVNWKLVIVDDPIANAAQYAGAFSS